MHEKIVILGVGNILLGDEGVGVHVINELRKIPLPENVQIFDGGTGSFGLLPIIESADRLIIVDAVKASGEPGTLYRFSLEALGNVPPTFMTSIHQMGLFEVLQIAELLGKKPNVEVIGIEPENLDTGIKLSYKVRSQMERIIESIIEAIGEKGRG